MQRIWYNGVFMKEAFLKAKTYYFERFLPALIPYMIIKFSSVECLPQNHQSTPSTQPYAKDVTVSMSKSSECPAIPTTKSPSNEFSTSSTTPKRTADQPSDTNINVYMGKPFVTSEKYTIPSFVSCPPVMQTTLPSDDPTISSSTVNKLSVTDINVSTGIPSKRIQSEKCIISSSGRATSDSAIPSRSSSKTVSMDDKTDDVQILGMT